MKIKFRYLSVLGLLAIILLPSQVFAGTSGDYVYKDKGDGTAEITDYIGTDTEIVIPSILDGLTVIEIGVEAFHDKNLTSVTIPNTVTGIWYRAFYSNQLTDIDIPNSVTNIASDVFADNQLTSVSIPNSLTSIASGAFRTNSLTSVTIPDTVTTIGFDAFKNNELTSITIPNGLTEIYPGVFESNNLSNIVIPGHITKIGKTAFLGNNLTSITIPDGVVSIGENAFSQNNITNVSISSSVTDIGINPFTNNPLDKITVDDNNPIYKDDNDMALYSKDGKRLIIGNQTGFIADGTEIIGEHSFANTNKNPNIIIPVGVKTIENNAFANGPLESIVIPNTVEFVGDYAFSSNKLTSLTIPDSVTSIGVRSFSYNDLTDLTISKNIINIGDYSFSFNELTSVEIPSSVIELGSNAFAFNNLNKATILNPDVTYASRVFNNNQSIPKDLTLMGYKDSTTDIHANSNGYNFEEIEIDQANSNSLIVHGDIQATILDFTVPTNLSFSIDPNENKFIAPTFTILNDTNAPLTIDVHSFQTAIDAETSFTDVLPNVKVWTNMSKADSSSFIALAIETTEPSQWKQLDRTTPLYAKEVQDNGATRLGALRPNSSVDLTFSAKHGNSFETATTTKYDIVFEFALQ